MERNNDNRDQGKDQRQDSNRPAGKEPINKNQPLHDKTQQPNQPKTPYQPK